MFANLQFFVRSSSSQRKSPRCLECGLWIKIAQMRFTIDITEKFKEMSRKFWPQCLRCLVFSCERGIPTQFFLFLANAKCDGADASTSWFSFTYEVVLASARVPIAGSIVPIPGGIHQFETILFIRRAHRRLMLIPSPVSPTRVLHWGSIHVVEIALHMKVYTLFFVLFSLQLLLLLWTSRQTNQYYKYSFHKLSLQQQPLQVVDKPRNKHTHKLFKRVFSLQTQQGAGHNDQQKQEGLAITTHL